MSNAPELDEAVADLMANVGFNIHRLRRKRGLSRKDLAWRARVSQRTIANLERRGSDLYAICRAALAARPAPTTHQEEG